MKVIFLDIDGVLNSELSCMESMKHEKCECDQLGRDTPHEMHIKWLNKIVELTGAKVVISSTWRSSYSSLGLWRLLWLCGFRGEVIGKTPILDSFRGTEIKCWLLEHKSRIEKEKNYGLQHDMEEIESFVIIDDDSDMEDLKPFLVKTKSLEGLQEEHVKKAIEILQDSKNPYK